MITNKLEAISTQIYEVEVLITRETDRQTYNTKLETFRVILSNMNTEEEDFINLLVSYSSNETALLPKIEKFIEDYKFKHYETHLFDFLFDHIIGSQSFVFETLHFYREYQNNNFTYPGLRSSTQKYLYDLIYFTLSKIVQSFSITELAINLKFKLSQSYHKEDIRFLEERKAIALGKFGQYQGQLFEGFNGEGDLEELMLLRSEVENPVRFKNIFQTFIAYEETVSRTDTCEGECHDYGNQPIQHFQCNGTLRYCMHDKSHVGVYTGAAEVIVDTITQLAATLCMPTLIPESCVGMYTSKTLQ